MLEKRTNMYTEEVPRGKTEKEISCRKIRVLICKQIFAHKFLQISYFVCKLCMFAYHFSENNIERC